MKRSGGVLFSGVVIAGIGIVACFAPGFNRLPRLLLILCLGPGELLLLLQMVLSRSKLRTWVRYGGIFWHLAISCSAVYCLSMLIAYFLWRHSLAATSLIAGLVLTHGIAGLYLAAVLRKVYRTYPGSEQTRGSAGLSTDQAMILLTGVFMIILGLMLIPVAFRLLPFPPPFPPILSPSSSRRRPGTRRHCPFAPARLISKYLRTYLPSPLLVLVTGGPRGALSPGSHATDHTR